MKNFAIGFTAFVLAVLTIFAITVHAQDKPVKPKTPPVLTDAQRAAYWKAFSQQQSAHKQEDEANSAMSKAVQEMIITCGQDATLQAPNGDPECIAKPEPVKPAEPKK